MTTSCDDDKFCLAGPFTNGEMPVRFCAADDGETDPSTAMVPLDNIQVVDPNSALPLEMKKDPELKKKQFWSAGDYESKQKEGVRQTGGLDHSRVHPKFLHSNATSHKWALGAVAELLDNSLDEIDQGATFVSVDVESVGDETVLAVLDNGGGMDPSRLHKMMSFGMCTKEAGKKIGQYGNGFKTSSMRLGADAIVLTRPKGGKSQSVGLLSYSFLRESGKEDVVVPLLDWDMEGKPLVPEEFKEDWKEKLDIVLQWSPFKTEEALLSALGRLAKQGTLIMVYNLWLNERGETELDLDADEADIRLRAWSGDITII